MWMSKEQKARLTAYRAAMDAAVESVRENTAALNKVAVMARPWAPGAYAVGDVRVYGGIPYRCVQAHDSSANPAWTPGATPALWMQYHGTTPETARPWVAASSTRGNSTGRSIRTSSRDYASLTTAIMELHIRRDSGSRARS